MRKSPGKWIEGILFGKKTSKSNLSKGRELSKSAREKPARVSSKELVPTLTVEAPLISNPVPFSVVDSSDNSDFEKGGAAKSASDRLVSSSTKQDGDMPTASDCSPPNESANVKLEHFATVVQASITSYQDRQAFLTLKGNIRLQSVATLVCGQGIVKFQAISRGHMLRRSSIADGQCGRQSLVAKDAKNRDSCGSKYSAADSLFKSAFVYKLLSSSPTAMPLRLQYGPGEPNSAWDWLLRWSISQVWAPNNSRHNETHDSKLQRVETEQTKPKSNHQRVRSATIRNDPNHSNAETLEHKNKGRKLSSQAVKSAQENPRTGNDKPRCGLKKTPNPVGESSNEAEIDIEKPKRHPVKRSKSPINKPTEDLAEAVSEHNDVKTSIELPGANSPVNELNCHLASEKHTKRVSDKSQDILLVDKDFKDDQIGNENYKCSPRTSLPAKHDDQEAAPESVRRALSYMATTASSKAKVKAQVSPRFEQDGVDKNELTRRHSLPSSTNGKLSSSPRVHRLVQVNGREGIKVDRSSSSSRDVIDKAIQVDWKRLLCRRRVYQRDGHDRTLLTV